MEGDGERERGRSRVINENKQILVVVLAHTQSSLAYKPFCAI